MAKLLEVLKANGVEITEEIEAKVMEEFVDKKDIELKNTEIAELKEQLKTRDKDIEQLKKVDGAKLQEELKNLQEKYKNDTESLKAKLSETELNSALDIEILKLNPKDPALVKAVLDMNKISYKEGKFEGLQEQLDQIKKERDYLLNNNEPTKTQDNPYTYVPGGGKEETKPTTLNDAVAEALGLQQ